MDTMTKLQAVGALVRNLNESTPEHRPTASLAVDGNDWCVTFLGGPTLPIYVYGFDDCTDSDRPKMILVVQQGHHSYMEVDDDTHRLNPDSVFVNMAAA